MKVIHWNLEIRHTQTLRGLGIYSNVSIPKNAIIEICPLVLLRCEFNHIPKELRSYVYDLSDVMNGSTFAVVMGYGGLYNHSGNANVHYEYNSEDNCFVYVAAKNIKIDDELLINYNGNHPHERRNDYWSSLVGIQLID